MPAQSRCTDRLFCRGAALLLVAAIALLTTGCGGPMSKSEYESQASAIGTKVDDSINTLNADQPSQADIQKTADSLRSATDELEALEPPKEIQPAHDQMIKGMKGMVATFDDLAQRLGDAKGDQGKMQAFLKAFNTPKAKQATDDLRKAQDAFNKAGYTVFGDGKAKPESDAVK